MEVREIKALLVLMRDYGLVELEIEDKKGKVRLVRGGARASVEETEASSADHIPARVATSIKMASRHVEATTEEGAKAAGKIDLQPNQKLIESPMVGTFYRAASPDSAPFVEEGSSIRKGQPLCIIEAMKMMNEIRAHRAGSVRGVLVKVGATVEPQTPLVSLE